jgi:hypothetical protein
MFSEISETQNDKYLQSYMEFKNSDYQRLGKGRRKVMKGG